MKIFECKIKTKDRKTIIKEIEFFLEQLKLKADGGGSDEIGLYSTWTIKNKQRIKMNTYNIKLKHDKGFITIKTYARNKKQAIKQICIAENCPKCAIKKIERINQ